MQLLAFRFAFAGNLLIAVFLVSVTFGITPLKVTDLVWLTGFPAIVLDNTPFALIGMCFISLSTYFDPSNLSLVSHQRKLAKLCFPVVLGFLLFIPLQFFVAQRTVSTIKKQELYQFESSARKIKFLSQKIQQSQTFDQLQNIMKTYQAYEIPQSERGKPLESLKSLLKAKTDEALALLKSRRRPDLVTASSWEAYRAAIRNSLYSFVYMLAFAVFAQRSRSEQSWLQEIMDGLLAKLYGVLQHRETRLAEETLEINQESATLPLAEHQLSSLHQQGLLDRAWISDHEHQDPCGESFSPNEHTGEGLDSNPSPQVTRPTSGVFSWLGSSVRGRRDAPTSFLQSLADQQDDAQSSATDLETTESKPFSTDQTLPSNDYLAAAQNRSAPPSQRRQRVTDLDYFEQLADSGLDETGNEPPEHRSSPKL